MDSGKFIDLKEVEIGGRTFAISKIPALKAQIVYNDIVKSVAENGVTGLTMLSTDTTKNILQYTALGSNGDWIPLDTTRVIEDTFKDVKDMLELVMHMVKENFGFLADGGLRTLLEIPTSEATESVS